MSVNFLKYLIWKTVNSAQHETGYVQTHGALIHYAAYGAGAPILLLHGGLADKLSWFSQLPWLVEAGRRVVLIDTRGHGNSTHGEQELSYEIFAEDTLQVLDKLKIRRTDIVGWSDGGIIALLLALQAPERVGRIVAISANFHPSGLIADMPAAEDETYQQLRNKILAWLRGFLSPPNENYATLEKELNHLWQTAPLLNPADLHAILAPTLVIAGENDVIQLTHSGDLAQTLRYGKIEIVLGAGHAAPITHANQINELIASFLGIEIN
jgi:pimeloyl-ACP methyl ester carboxylesterase